MNFIEYDNTSLIEFYKENGLEFNEDRSYFGDDVKSFVILKNKEIIGAVSISNYKQKSFIDALAVKKVYRKKGYGKLLLEKAIQELRKPIYIISKSNEFFLKNGFTYNNENLIDAGCKTCEEYEVTCFPKVMIYK